MSRALSSALAALEAACERYSRSVQLSKPPPTLTNAELITAASSTIDTATIAAIAPTSTTFRPLPSSIDLSPPAPSMQMPAPAAPQTPAMPAISVHQLEPNPEPLRLDEDKEVGRDVRSYSTAQTAPPEQRALQLVRPSRWSRLMSYLGLGKSKR